MLAYDFVRRSVYEVPIEHIRYYQGRIHIGHAHHHITSMHRCIIKKSLSGDMLWIESRNLPNPCQKDPSSFHVRIKVGKATL